MKIKREKIERKLKEAREKLAEAEEKYEQLAKVTRERDHYKSRVDKLTRMLSQ